MSELATKFFFISLIVFSLQIPTPCATRVRQNDRLVGFSSLQQTTNSCIDKQVCQVN